MNIIKKFFFTPLGSPNASAILAASAGLAFGSGIAGIVIGSGFVMLHITGIVIGALLFARSFTAPNSQRSIDIAKEMDVLPSGEW